VKGVKGIKEMVPDWKVQEKWYRTGRYKRNGTGLEDTREVILPLPSQTESS